MANHIFSVAALCVVLVLMADAATRSFNKTILSSNQCAFQQPRCGFCRQPITVTITATNKLVEPKFEQNVTIKYSQRPLLHFLQKAADTNGAFKFESTYYPTLGHFIDSINGVRGFRENKTFWHIISVDGVGSLECGASSYIPVNGDNILFNFTTWAAAGFDY